MPGNIFVDDDGTSDGAMVTPAASGNASDGRWPAEPGSARAENGRRETRSVWDLAGVELAHGQPDRGKSLFLTGVDVPMQPWAQAVFKERQANNSKDDPEGFCLPPGIPEQMVNPLPWKIMQTPGAMVILFEQWANHRPIFTDGRPLPEVSKPSWSATPRFQLLPDTEVLEYICENQRWAPPQ